jgi:hypothetical protein
MNLACVRHGLWPRLETRFACRDHAQVLRRIGEIRIKLQSFKGRARDDVLHMEDRGNYSLGSGENQRSLAILVLRLKQGEDAVGPIGSSRTGVRRLCYDDAIVYT